jgi:magnesium-transporting ATPase (P-type)
MVEIRVVRGGREVAVKVDEVLAGDLVLVDTGAKLPADGLLLRGSDFKTNESA